MAVHSGNLVRIVAQPVEESVESPVARSENRSGRRCVCAGADVVGSVRVAVRHKSPRATAVNVAPGKHGSVCPLPVLHAAIGCIARIRANILVPNPSAFVRCARWLADPVFTYLTAWAGVSALPAIQNVIAKQLFANAVATGEADVANKIT